MIVTWPTAHLLIRLLWGATAGFCLVSTTVRAQELFGSPDAGTSALIAAMRDNKSSRLYSVLGASARDILFSGDAVRDAGDRERFVAAYDVKHSIVEAGRTATLLVGEDAFPFPIPMIRSSNGWKFVVEAGRREILARRIGRNELDAIQASLAIVDAQYDYVSQGHDGQPAGSYAQRIVSRPGKQDGLYWPTGPGEAQSPLGELAAEAAAEGYVAEQERQPFHGYYFKILAKQGPAAVGGATDYIANGRMIGGFAVLAYPATYARSGITSFIVNHQGTVYQQDLGPGTSRIAARMSSFDPRIGWEKVETNKSP